MTEREQISYAKTVYGQDEINAVLKCLSESTQMGKYSRRFEAAIGCVAPTEGCCFASTCNCATVKFVSES